jgi:predicted acetyltransferase
MPDIDFRAATWADKPVLARLLELYQYDMTPYWPQDLNAHGEFGFAVDRYLRNPRLRAFLFLVDGQYAGFGLVDPDVSLAGNDFWMGQFFVMQKYRRLGVGRRGAHFIFDQFRGRWEVGQMPLNAPARAFWRRTIGDYTGGRFVEHELNDERWQGTLQCFDNRGTAAPPDATLRPAVPADAPALAVLAGQVFIDTYATAGINAMLAQEVLDAFSVAAMSALLQHPATRVLLAERDGHLLGFAQLALGRAQPRLEAGPAAELERLYVLDRFARRGLGARLLDAGQRLAAAAGAQQLWLTAWPHNERALRFYARQGWRDLGPVQVMLQGQAIENRLLVRPVGAASA